MCCCAPASQEFLSFRPFNAEVESTNICIYSCQMLSAIKQVQLKSLLITIDLVELINFPWDKRAQTNVFKPHGGLTRIPRPLSGTTGKTRRSSFGPAGSRRASGLAEAGTKMVAFHQRKLIFWGKESWV